MIEDCGGMNKIHLLVTRDFIGMKEILTQVDKRIQIKVSSNKYLQSNDPIKQAKLDNFVQIEL